MIKLDEDVKYFKIIHKYTGASVAAFEGSLLQVENLFIEHTNWCHVEINKSEWIKLTEEIDRSNREHCDGWL